MANASVSERQKINSRQWEELRCAVGRAARAFHYENKAQYVIFQLIRQQFSCRASELPAVHFDAAMATIQQAESRASQFLNLRYQLETEALKRIFGPAALEGVSEIIEAALDALGEPMDIHHRPVFTDNVVQFPNKGRVDATTAEHDR
jgi:hypothetical protein